MKKFDVPYFIQTLFTILVAIIPTIDLIKWLFYKINKKSPPTQSKVAQVKTDNMNSTNIHKSIEINGGKRDIIDELDLNNYNFKRRIFWSLVYFLFLTLLLYNFYIVAKNNSTWNTLKKTDFSQWYNIKYSILLSLSCSSQTIILSAKILLIILFFVILRSLLSKHIIDRAINISSSLLGIISNLFLIKVFSSIDSNTIATSIIHLYQNPNLSQFLKFFLLVALIFQFVFFILYLSQTTTIIYPDELDTVLSRVRFMRKISKFIFAAFPFVFALYWQYIIAI